MKKINFLALILVLTSLVGCAGIGNRIESNVSVFHELPPITATTTIAVFPGDEAQQNSLEFKSYSKLLASYLSNVGMKVVSMSDHPEMVAMFAYGIDQGKQETNSYAIPNFGVTGYSGAYTTGNISKSGSYSATTTAIPQYGVTGVSSGIVTSTVYTRYLNIGIFTGPDSKKLEKLYEGKLISQGTCSHLNTVMPILFQAFFKEFPRESGSSRKVIMPWSGEC